MPAQTITPVLVTDVPTALTDLSAGPPAGQEWSITVRATNRTALAILYRLLVTNTAGTEAAYGAYDIEIPNNDARDVEVNLTLPTGYKLRHRASATGLDVRVTGRLRSAA